MREFSTASVLHGTCSCTISLLVSGGSLQQTASSLRVFSSPGIEIEVDMMKTYVSAERSGGQIQEAVPQEGK